MHDLSALELNEGDEFELAEDREWEDEDEDEDEGLEESEELEAAARLLSVGSEAELDNFLGDLIKKATGIVGRSVKAATGNSLGKLLKGIARNALPMVATAIGGPAGGLATKAALSAFGLEAETLSEEDQELELARRYVRLAHGASRRAARVRAVRNPRVQARAAVRWAMRRHAPNLYRQYRHHRRPDARLGWQHRWTSGYPGYPSYPGYPGYPATPDAAPYDNQAAYPAPYPPAPPPPAPHVCARCSAGLPAPEPAPSPAAAPVPPAAAPVSDAPAAPGELEEESEYGVPLGSTPGQAGRWVRRGRVILLFGV